MLPRLSLAIESSHAGGLREEIRSETRGESLTRLAVFCRSLDKLGGMGSAPRPGP